MNVRIDVGINVTVKEILVLCIAGRATTDIHMQVSCFEVEGTAASMLRCLSNVILDEEVKGMTVANNKLHIRV